MGWNRNAWGVNRRKCTPVFCGLVCHGFLLPPAWRLQPRSSLCSRRIVRPCWPWLFHDAARKLKKGSQGFWSSMYCECHLLCVNHSESRSPSATHTRRLELSVFLRVKNRSGYNILNEHNKPEASENYTCSIVKYLPSNEDPF